MNLLGAVNDIRTLTQSPSLSRSDMDDVQIDPSLLSRDVQMSHANAGNTAMDAEQDAEMADLFGNDEDVTQVSKEKASGASSETESLSAEEQERRRALEYAEDDIPPEVAVEVREAEVSFPNLPTPRSTDGLSWVIRLPSYISVDSKPFHQDTYMGPEDEEPSRTSMHEQSMTIKLKVENTLRWRWTKDKAGNDVRQSNSRVIRWSDGSLSLRLGKELYDITQNVDHSGGISRQSFGNTQSNPSVPVSHSPGGKSQGLTYLVAQHKRSQVLQAETAITGTMTLRPMNMNSEAHQMLVRSVGQKHRKIARLRMTAEPTWDPERELLELKKESEKRDRKRHKELRGAVSRTPRPKRTRPEEVFDSPSEAGDEHELHGDESDEDSPRARRRSTRRGGAEEDYQEDDFVTADTPDDGETKKSSRGQEEAEEDDLEKLEARIEAQQRKSGKVHSEEEEEEEGEPSGGDMDVESEEDEDDFQIRKARSGGRKVRLEDEDEME